MYVEVPQSYTVHDRKGRSHIRVGASKRPLNDNERLRLAQNRAQSRYERYDKQTVPDTGFETLSERLWLPLLSVAAAENPRNGLINQNLLGQDRSGIVRATVAGVLLCAQSPQDWLPQARILATHYRGKDRASGQLDSQEINGPLAHQIEDAVKFVTRNMRVAARKLPARVDMPQYRPAAVFEAIVNAVAHRNYSMTARNIRLSMFRDRLEIDSPGQLPNGMTIESMESSQATRNEVIASVFGRFPVGDVPGTNLRHFLMERRGDGVSIIKSETKEATGQLPQYKILDASNVVLTIPAARLELSPAESTVSVHSEGEPLSGVEVLALFPNKTYQQATTNEIGEAALDLYTSILPMTVYAAAPGYAGGLVRDWLPNQGGLLMEMRSLEKGGSVVFPQSTGHLPDLQGRLNPIRDSSDRTYLYADNIAIEEGRPQPVHFRLGKTLRLTDSFGYELSVTILDILGKSSLLQYRPHKS